MSLRGRWLTVRQAPWRITGTRWYWVRYPLSYRRDWWHPQRLVTAEEINKAEAEHWNRFNAEQEAYWASEQLEWARREAGL